MAGIPLSLIRPLLRTTDDDTIRQHLGPKGKRTAELMDEIERAITLETARHREAQPEGPPWNVIFRTAEEFNRADRASRLVKAESLREFCRNAILTMADGILSAKSRSADSKTQPPG